MERVAAVSAKSANVWCNTIMKKHQEDIALSETKTACNSMKNAEVSGRWTQQLGKK